MRSDDDRDLTIEEFQALVAKYKRIRNGTLTDPEEARRVKETLGRQLSRDLTDAKELLETLDEFDQMDADAQQRILAGLSPRSRAAMEARLRRRDATARLTDREASLSNLGRAFAESFTANFQIRPLLRAMELAPEPKPPDRPTKYLLAREGRCRLIEVAPGTEATLADTLMQSGEVSLELPFGLFQCDACSVKAGRTAPEDRQRLVQLHMAVSASGLNPGKILCDMCRLNWRPSLSQTCSGRAALGLLFACLLSALWWARD